MANTLTQVGIETGNAVEAYHVTQSIDAFTGAIAYDITLSGSFNMTGPINGQSGLINPLTASYAISSSRAISASFVTSASYALSSSRAISASFVTSASYALSSSYAVTASHVPNTFVQNGNSFGTTATLGTNDTQPLIFETNNTQRIYISSSGNIGINTILPTARLFISESTSQIALRISQAGTGNALQIEDAASDTSPFIVDQNGNAAIGKTSVDSYGTNPYKLQVSGSTNLSSPQSFTTSQPPVLSITNLFDSFNRMIEYATRISGSATYVKRIISNGGYHANNPVFHNYACDIIGESNNPTSGLNNNIDYTLGWRWGTFNSSNYQIYMQLNSSGSKAGNLGLGLGSFGDPNYLIHLGADSAGKPGGGSWTDSSDERLKENIELADLDICYNVVKNLPLKRYRWKNNSYTDEQIVDRNVVGWIAQDVADVFPKAVNLKPFTQVDGTVLEDCLSLNETMINRTLYGAVQKLIQENETLKSEIEAIKTHLGL